MHMFMMMRVVGFYGKVLMMVAILVRFVMMYDSDSVRNAYHHSSCSSWYNVDFRMDCFL